MWVRKFDSDSFTEKRNWSGRNEIIATSGRLHPSGPQNKRLYAPWTKDYSHTRQDRWIQTELAFTLAKNATKPDPVEIISLQTTRKENNWKTEETLARAVVTLETERIKLVQSLMYMMMMMMWTIRVKHSSISLVEFRHVINNVSVRCDASLRAGVDMYVWWVQNVILTAILRNKSSQFPLKATCRSRSRCAACHYEKRST